MKIETNEFKYLIHSNLLTTYESNAELDSRPIVLLERIIITSVINS